MLFAYVQDVRAMAGGYKSVTTYFLIQKSFMCVSVSANIHFYRFHRVAKLNLIALL